MKTFALLLLVLTLLLGCDVNKKERNEVQARLDSTVLQMEQFRAAAEDVERKITKIEQAVKEAREDFKTNDAEYEKNKNELAKYSMDHKLAAAAAAIAAGGTAAMFSELSDEDKGALAVPTAIAAGYCLFNGDECTEVSSRIAYYGTQIAFFKDKTTKLAETEAALRKEMSALESERTRVKSALSGATAQANIYREKVGALACKLPLCL